MYVRNMLEDGVRWPAFGGHGREKKRRRQLVYLARCASVAILRMLCRLAIFSKCNDLSHCFIHRSTRRFSAMLDVSPPVYRCKEGDTIINRDAFRKSIQVLAACVPASKTGSVLKAGAMKQ